MITLYDFWRSTAAYRVRIALNYKNLPHNVIKIDLINQKQFDESYKKLNPQARLPYLVDGDIKIGQSFAILEYLEEQYPLPSLLPKSHADRAKIRNIAQIIVSDVHPLNNSGVLKFLRGEFNDTEQNIKTWYHHWVKLSFDAIYPLIDKEPGKFCFADQVTLADVCLIPHVYNAIKADFLLDHYPKIQNIYEYCLTLPYFIGAVPENQSDYDESVSTGVP